MAHYQSSFHQMWENLKKLKKMNLNNTNPSQVSVVKADNDDEIDMLLAIEPDVAKFKRVMEFIASMHVSQDWSMFEDLETKGDHGHIKLSNGKRW